MQDAKTDEEPQLGHGIFGLYQSKALLGLISARARLCSSEAPDATDNGMESRQISFVGSERTSLIRTSPRLNWRITSTTFAQRAWSLMSPWTIWIQSDKTVFTSQAYVRHIVMSVCVMKPSTGI